MGNKKLLAAKKEGACGREDIAMVYILTLLIFTGGNVAVATAEYNTSEACEAARAIDGHALDSAFRQPMLVATCTPKG